jgi:hypothetical protein
MLGTEIANEARWAYESAWERGQRVELERVAPFEYVELCNMVLVLQPPYTQDKINEIQQAAKRAAAIRRGMDT